MQPTPPSSALSPSAMRFSVSTRRSTRTLGCALVLAVCAGARPAGAQACQAASLATVLANGFSCTVGGVRFFGFSILESYSNFRTDGSSGTPPTIQLTTIDQTLTRLTPFAAGGWVGFDLANFGTTASASNVTRRSRFNVGAGYTLYYNFESSAPVTAWSTTWALSRTQSGSRLGSENSILNGMGPNWGDAGDCGSTFSQGGSWFGAVTGSGRSETPCTVPLTRGNGFVSFGANADASGDGANSTPRSITVTASVNRLALQVQSQVAPEPTTVTLLGGGLAALGGVALRRRRRG